jgi:ubiquitin-conjugating enzyme E2 H
MAGSRRFLARALADVRGLQLWAAATPGARVDAPDAPSLPMTVLVTMPGPADSLYDRGVFTVRCNLPEGFPAKAPALAFLTRIWHPNIEATSGAVCLSILKNDVDAGWSAAITLSALFSQYVPQLLQDPEPSDPFNGSAAAMLIANRDQYARFTRAHVDKHAAPGATAETAATSEAAAAGDEAATAEAAATTEAAAGDEAATTEAVAGAEDDAEDDAKDASATRPVKRRCRRAEP